MNADLENIVEEHSTRLLKHLAVCILTGHRLTQGEAKNLIRSHIRSAVQATERALTAHRSHVTTEKEV